MLRPELTVDYTPPSSIITNAGGTLAYTEGDIATVIDSTLTITDIDDTNIESAAITISNGLVTSEDILDFTSLHGITVSYNSGTGILSLNGAATLAQYEEILESVTYQNTNDINPSTSNRTVTWVVNDGDSDSTGVTSTITVTEINSIPVSASIEGTALAYTENGAATTINIDHNAI